MINGPQPHDDVEAYVLGALDEHDVTLFAQHLANCPSCQHETASYVPIVNAMRGMPPPAAPAFRSPRSLFGRSRRAFYGIAAALLLVSGGFGGAALEHVLNSDMVTVAEMEINRAQEVTLAGSEFTGRAIVGEARRRTAFVVRGLPVLADNRTYQVWVRGNEVSSPGLLRRSAQGFWLLVVPGDVLREARTVFVTSEPFGGSHFITGTPIVSGSV